MPLILIYLPLSIAFGTLVNVQASVAFQLLLFSFNFVPWLCLVNYCRCKSKMPLDVQRSYGVFINVVNDIYKKTEVEGISVLNPIYFLRLFNPCVPLMRKFLISH